MSLSRSSNAPLITKEMRLLHRVVDMIDACGREHRRFQNRVVLASRTICVRGRLCRLSRLQVTGANDYEGHASKDRNDYESTGE
jgi:hypothetical protein